jgi:hypothetical protein
MADAVIEAASSLTVSTPSSWNTPEGAMRMTTVKTFVMAASCGMLLLGAVSAHARLSANGENLNGQNLNGQNLNGQRLNGLASNGQRLNGLAPNATTRQWAPLPAGPHERFPCHGLSQRALGAAAVLSGSDAPPPVERPAVR